jgi:hypothetical protein
MQIKNEMQGKRSSGWLQTMLQRAGFHAYQSSNFTKPARDPDRKRTSNASGQAKAQLNTRGTNSRTCVGEMTGAQVAQ